MNKFIESIADLLAPPSPALRVITITSPVDYSEAPAGFFNVECASGKKSLGYRGSFLAWEVGEHVRDGAVLVHLTVPRSELPTVKLAFQKPTDGGSSHIGGCTVLDTDSLEEDNSTVQWDGTPPSSGEWV